jgi:hypothetical protein
VKTGLRSDDRVPTYTSSSSSLIKRDPDFAAPGQHVVGLHVKNSFEDIEMYRDCFNATNSVGWESSVFGPNDRFMRGSGTSEAAALTSGAVALMLSRNPALKPDQIKRMLSTTAQPFGGGSNQVGAGAIDLVDAYNMTPPTFTQSHTPPTGGGTLENARGSAVVYSFKDKDTTYHPTACEDMFQWIDNPSLTKTYTSAQMNLINFNYTNYCKTSAFSNSVAVGTLDSPTNAKSETLWNAWTTPAGAAYQVWSGNTSMTMGNGLIDDPNKVLAPGGGLLLVNGKPVPVLGQVWASGIQSGGKAWPTFGSITVKGTDAPTWNSALQSWTLRTSSWTRMSLTGSDFTSHSLRDSDLS